MMFNLTSAIRKERFHMTVRELAKQIGVSPATISIVLNGKKGVSEDTRKKVLDAVKSCQYTPPARMNFINGTKRQERYWRDSPDGG